MCAEQILKETRDRVLYVTIDRAEKHNALSLSILASLRALFDAQRIMFALPLVIA